MIVTEDGAVLGSIDVAQLSQLVADGTVDPETLDASVRAQLDAHTGADNQDEGEDLSKLLKADLVERAEAAGIDTTGMNKADLVAALEEQEG